jgi:hypothetical protein
MMDQSETTLSRRWTLLHSFFPLFRLLLMLVLSSWSAGHALFRPHTDGAILLSLPLTLAFSFSSASAVAILPLLPLLSIAIRVGDSLLQSVRGFPRIRCLSFCTKFGFLKPSFHHYLLIVVSAHPWFGLSPTPPVSSQFQVV